MGMVVMSETREEEFRRKVEEIRREREATGNQNRDGFVETWRHCFTYRGIPYEIALLRYFSFNDPNARLNRIGKHAVLEYPEPLRELHNFIEATFGNSEWLFQDTLHGFQHDWTEQMMIKEMHERAKEDIDWLLDRAREELGKKLQTLRNLIEKALKETSKDE